MPVSFPTCGSLEGSGLFGLFRGPFWPRSQWMEKGRVATSGWTESRSQGPSLQPDPPGSPTPPRGQRRVRARHLPAEVGTAGDPRAGPSTCSCGHLPPASSLGTCEPRDRSAPFRTRQVRSPGQGPQPRVRKPPGALRGQTLGTTPGEHNFQVRPGWQSKGVK